LAFSYSSLFSKINSAGDSFSAFGGAAVLRCCLTAVSLIEGNKGCFSSLTGSEILLDLIF